VRVVEEPGETPPLEVAAHRLVSQISLYERVDNAIEVLDYRTIENERKDARIEGTHPRVADPSLKAVMRSRQ